MYCLMCKKHFRYDENLPSPSAMVSMPAVMAEVIRFGCPECAKAIKAPAVAAGRKGVCPACSARVMIPTAVAAVEELVQLVAEGAPPTGPTVPVKVSFPKDLGSVETKVSQQTADIITAVAVGGLCVAAGVALAFLCPPAAAALAVAAGAANGRSGS